MFVTFYSYKGGVGRTLALANIACLMAEDKKHPQRILVWDFDLEAPGLHRIFPPKEPISYGFVDYVYKYAKTGELPNIDDYIYESQIDGIDVLPAGKVNSAYCDKLQQIDWLSFFSSESSGQELLFTRVTEKLKKGPYDYVLIDSRTGLNDQAGICTQILADLLIVLFRLSDQNLDGLEHLIPTIKSKLISRKKEDVEIIPIASQVASRSLHSRYERAKDIFQDDIEYIRFDEGLLDAEKLFTQSGYKSTVWPAPPIIDDYKRVTETIRGANKDDTLTRTAFLRSKIQEGDFATALVALNNLLPRRPGIAEIWKYLDLLINERTTTASREELKKLVDKIFQEFPNNYFALMHKAAFIFLEKDTPHKQELCQAREYLKKALEVSPDNEKASVYRAISLIESAQGNIDIAIDALKNARNLMPDNSQIALDLAMMYIRLGYQYFALAAEILDEIPKDIEDQKYIPLVYLRTFLEEDDKAENAIKNCKHRRQLVSAYAKLFRGDKENAINVAKNAMNTEEGKKLGNENWVEFFFCADDLEYINKIKTANKDKEIGFILSLAGYIQGNDIETKEEVKAKWNMVVNNWNFRELLFYREFCVKNESYKKDRLDIIEELIQFQELRMIQNSGASGLLREAKIRQQIMKVELEIGKLNKNFGFLSELVNKNETQF